MKQKVGIKSIKAKQKSLATPIDLPSLNSWSRAAKPLFSRVLRLFPYLNCIFLFDRSMMDSGVLVAGVVCKTAIGRGISENASQFVSNFKVGVGI